MLPARISDQDAAPVRVADADAATRSDIALDHANADELVDQVTDARAGDTRPHCPAYLAIARAGAAAVYPFHDVRQGLDAPWRAVEGGMLPHISSMTPPPWDICRIV
jgi:hypothetical protein